VLIVANVVSGAVVASYRRIGVLKSIGFSPAQVIAAYVTRIGVPAVVGCLFGLAFGNLLAIPVLQKSAQSFGVGTQLVPVWVDVVTPLVMCALVGITALLPALRAGRLSAVQAITLGHAPRQGRGQAAHRLTSRLRLPRAVTIGLAAPFARPARTAGTLAAVMFGVTAVIFAVGLDSTLARAEQGQSLAATAPVQVGLASGNAMRVGSSQDRAILSVLQADPSTRREVAMAQTVVGVAGQAQQANVTAFDGNAGWLGYGVISGHWYRGTGQVVVNTAYLDQTGLSVGDTTTFTAGGKPVRARIVGQVFIPGSEPALMSDWQTLGPAADLGVGQYVVAIKPGVSTSSYVAALGDKLGSRFAVYGPEGGQFYVVADSLIGLLTLMMAIAAGLGVLNTVLLGTRDRVHDIGVFKAVGMTPRQTISMVMCWIAAPAIVAAVIAIPIATAMHAATANAMATAAFTGLPASFLDVYHPVEIVLLGLSGLAIAAAGALLPATWAARSRTAVALRTE
jgi:putative ABC transport system permease protein